MGPARIRRPRQHRERARDLRRLIAATLLAACGGGGSGSKAAIPQEPATPITVEWKVEQGEAGRVDVTLVVDGAKQALGSLEAATATEPGTPNTCALRAASPRRTEIVCGDGNALAADLVERELVVTRVAGEGRSEVVRVPVYGDMLSIKPLALPFDE